MSPHPHTHTHAMAANLKDWCEPSSALVSRSLIVALRCPTHQHPRLLQDLGSLAIGVSFGYMTFAMFVTALLMAPVAAATFRVNEGEGYFRWMHARIKEFAECGGCPSTSSAQSAVVLG